MNAPMNNYFLYESKEMSGRSYSRDTNPQQWYKHIYRMLGDFDIQYRELTAFVSFNLAAEVEYLDSIMMDENETEEEKTQRLYDYYRELLMRKETWDSEAEEAMAAHAYGGQVKKRNHRIGMMK